METAAIGLAVWIAVDALIVLGLYVRGRRLGRA